VVGYNAFSTSVFVTGLVLFVGDVNAVSLPADHSKRPPRLVPVAGRDSTPGYVQTDGAVLGILGPFAMLSSTLV
jgi:hypothetical protein